jgi:hypothetical protein
LTCAVPRGRCLMQEYCFWCSQNIHLQKAGQHIPHGVAAVTVSSPAAICKTIEKQKKHHQLLDPRQGECSPRVCGIDPPLTSIRDLEICRLIAYPDNLLPCCRQPGKIRKKGSSNAGAATLCLRVEQSALCLYRFNKWLTRASI